MILPVAKASAQRAISADHATKNQKLPPITYNMLDTRRHILLMIIVVLLPSLSQRMPAGTWKIRDTAYQTAV